MSRKIERIDAGRRLLTLSLLAAAALPLLPQMALAQDAPTTLKLTPGAQIQPISIAVTDFVSDGKVNVDLASIIGVDLKRCGLFEPIDKKAFVEQIANPDTAPNFPSWQSINAQALVAGRVSKEGDGRLKAQFRLWDIVQGKQLVGQQYFSDPGNSRRVAHIIADAIFKAMTGFDGAFDTRVAFVDESGTKDQRRKRLAVMDQDGANVRYLTRGDDLVLTPRFSPTSQEVTYMSFGQSDPRVYLFNIETGQRAVVGNFPGMTFSPRFSPDGRKVIMSLETSGAANINTLDLQTKAVAPLTNGASIDTAPSYSPDGMRISFESDRGGKQQIYVMGANGGQAQRISFGDGAYSTPVWSPRGDYIAFTKQMPGRFAIGIMKADGTGERILTEGYHNEGPTWAPNGRVIMFFRDPGGNGGPALYTVDVSGRNEQLLKTPSYASDPAWSPLLQ